MRIISGSNKGHIIRPPKGLPIRPTTDKSKESLFNILDNRFYFEDSDVLDLFSGGGSVSLEFCSRGVKSLVSVDLHPGCTNFLKSESLKLGFNQIDVVKADVMYFLRNDFHTYDIIFCDAPYAWKDYHKMIYLVFEQKLLNAGGIFIVEHHSVTKVEDIPNLERQRAHGQNVLSFFRNLDEIGVSELENKEEIEP